MRLIITVTFLLFASYIYALSPPIYAGHNSNEAILKFNYFVELTTRDAPSEARAKDLIAKKVTHLFGSLSNNRPVASPKMEYDIKLLNFEKYSMTTYRVHYNYQGKIVIASTDQSKIKFVLPRDPLTIYHKACTDSHYWQEEYFWYFWNPRLRGCPLDLGKDFDFVTGELENLENTVQTYPKYQDLFVSGTMRIDVLMGMDDESLSNDPFNSSDLAASNYRGLHQELLRLGFTVESKKNIGDGFIQILNKNTPRGKIQIRYFFGPTSLDGSTFHELYKNALEEANVVIYDGHSGLGEYLDLNQIENKLGEEINFNSELYQIYFINGCSSYPYYNNQYFERKGGSENLEIITNGLATLFSAINPSTNALIRMLNTWAMTGTMTTYQELVEQADSNNLIGVNGDEDDSNL